MHVPETVPAALDRAAESFGDGEALVDHSGEHEVRLTYRELRERVRELARFLLAEDVRPGDRVALNAPNTHHWVIAALAALHVGAVLVPINTRFTASETRDVLERSSASALVVAGTFLGRDRAAELRADAARDDRGPDSSGGTGSAGPIPGLPALRTVLRLPVERTEPPVPWCTDWADVGDRARSVPAQRASEVAASVRGTDLSDMLYTSGTTGRSKGVLSAHRQALAVADAWAGHGEVNAADRYLVVNPFFHSFGYRAGILVCLLRGATIVPMPVFDTRAALDLVQRERITVLPGAPTLYQSILDEPARAEHDLSSLRLAVTGAASVPVVLIERMQRELSFATVLTAYGLTEAVVATMCRSDDDDETVANTCGRPTAGFELRIADAAGRPVPAGSTGEVLLRGPNTMLGYRDDPQQTAAAIDADGWLHTGDVGRVDSRGGLTITDRLKDMYICGGFNVYPAEVEQALARLDGVAETAVIGVADDRLGEVGKAYVVARSGHALTEHDVLTFCRDHLANYKLPRHVEFRPALPRNPSGKVLKHELR
ncbi:FadD3 family acyl-CoA ligase [Saccharopolyspora gloriosae]|uniref:Acyl-CoA synthetase (AMP-forming)/AMP-acid ligase II n=1 Tax=Saccharopolyspora gloriosae TaxID=455344 RepID=A0A840NJK7_9PSEU|nr:AMP-binding protein [Saccharopolyspora gloriosae]MBB5069342.1 acyl-CoA synthetase (AMP-forming)/AMP-acid ligase II [Saccharopolyspora gloriosae]